ncbi:MAG TPA: AAA family ATPase [Firmicutes bacterium]|nr:AAA family ATPase [Bacillota bacterium]
MQNLFEISEKAVELVTTTYIRSHMKWLQQKDRLIGIRGSRGVGKTTLLLQYAKRFLINNPYIYISLDNLYFTENKLVDFADEFVKNGGKFLLIDEVHHYPAWSAELKNIYDNYPELKVIYTGSSLIHLIRARTDLSRRSVNYTLPGLSLREYINITESKEFPVVSLKEIIQSHNELSKKVWSIIKPVKKYNEYLETGYYPFFLENQENYRRKLLEVTLQVLESDIPLMTGMNVNNIIKIKQLLYVISESSPFKPNIEKLSERIGIARNTLKEYIYYLGEALVLNLLTQSGKGISRLSKPEKIFLHHPNLMYALSGKFSDTGTLRETFFVNQVSFNHTVNHSRYGDFLVDNNLIFEIGGKNKTGKQIKGVKNAFLAIDNIESGYLNEIPLWLFGFLY